MSAHIEVIPPKDLTTWIPVMEVPRLSLDPLASIVPSLCYVLSPSVHSTILSGTFSSSFTFLKARRFLLRTGITFEWFILLDVLYKCLNRRRAVVP